MTTKEEDSINDSLSKLNKYLDGLSPKEIFEAASKLEKMVLDFQDKNKGIDYD
jgi:hypothetical protein